MCSFFFWNNSMVFDISVRFRERTIVKYHLKIAQLITFWKAEIKENMIFQKLHLFCQSFTQILQQNMR